jgi:hypothetical protein
MTDQEEMPGVLVPAGEIEAAAKPWPQYLTFERRCGRNVVPTEEWVTCERCGGTLRLSESASIRKEETRAFSELHRH